MVAHDGNSWVVPQDVVAETELGLVAVVTFSKLSFNPVVLQRTQSRPLPVPQPGVAICSGDSEHLGRFCENTFV